MQHKNSWVFWKAKIYELLSATIFALRLAEDSPPLPQHVVYYVDVKYMKTYVS